jgi:spore coat polysaccharide biosynthesis protein SpsF
LVSGVLIHINPEFLNIVYERMVFACKRFLLINEYYNPVPVSVPYRGHENRLFKRDFAGEIMDRHPEMKLADYGFIYHRDNNFPKDDCTFFLLEKQKSSRTNL